MSKVKHWPTRKIKEVLEENFIRGIDGADFEDIKHELEQELWKRQNKELENQTIDEDNEYEGE